MVAGITPSHHPSKYTHPYLYLAAWPRRDVHVHVHVHDATALVAAARLLLTATATLLLLVVVVILHLHHDDDDLPSWIKYLSTRTHTKHTH